MNRLFVVKKPTNIGSNRYLSKIKRKYGIKKAGFSGTLDPFAQGVLIIAFGQFTKLFQFLKKAPKSYRATLWLGAESEAFDIEKVSRVEILPSLDSIMIEEVIKSLKGDITYLPPKYCAKKINGQKAYTLARANQEVNLKEITSHISDAKLIHYMHPFITFDITITEGGYIRSIGQIIAEKLGTFGTLSALERLHEGDFIYEGEKALNPLEYLNLEENFYLGDLEDLHLGRKVPLENFQEQREGDYFLNLDTMLTVITINDGKVTYRLNGVKLC
ncbi:MAG TPA: tRNA pseudouridine(55) synthase TruB [Campylobacterales bacterium]|nr:tRNA pseudouridine(55) synthase TruB [Campylobacterales bacterium]